MSDEQEHKNADQPSELSSNELTLGSTVNPGKNRLSLDLDALVPKASLQAVRTAVKRFLGNVKPTPEPGRTERMRMRVEGQVLANPITDLLPEGSEVKVRLELNESFGKPLLATLDIVGSLPPDALTEMTAEETADLTGLFIDLLDRSVQQVWDNPEVAPVAVRGRIVASGVPLSAKTERRLRPSRHPKEVVVADMRSLGYQDEIARVEDLYEKFGSPFADPDWHP